MVDIAQPGPDPTPRTVEAIYREIAALKELSETWRVGYDRAITLLQDKADAMPTPALVQASVDALKEAVVEQNRSSDLAVSKSEAATTKQIDAIRDMLDDIKGRVDRMEEGRTVAAVNTSADKSDKQFSQSTLIAMVALGLAGVSFFVDFSSRDPEPPAQVDRTP